MDGGGEMKGGGGRGPGVAIGVDFIGFLRFWGGILLTLADISSPPNAANALSHV